MSHWRFGAAWGCCFNIIAIGALLFSPPGVLAQQYAEPHDKQQHEDKEQAHEEHAHEEHDEFSSPGMHVHGKATLTMILEGNEAMVALQSAAYNIVGFEHAPQNHEQRQEIAAALDILRQGKWFAINPQAGCDLIDADANTDLTAEVSSKHHDFYANISIVCQQPARLNELTVTLFNLVPSVEKISVQWVLNGQQGATELSLTNNTVTF